jgi:hypothetical protein
MAHALLWRRRGARSLVRGLLEGGTMLWTIFVPLVVLIRLIQGRRPVSG